MAAVCRTSRKAPRKQRCSTAHALQRTTLSPVSWAVAIAFPVMGVMPALAAQYGPSVPSIVSAQIPGRTQLPVPVGDVTRGQVYNQTANSGNRKQWLQYGSSTLVENGATQSIYQGSQRGIYNWQSFNVGADATVNFFFNQANSSALNRVSNAVNPSVIMGHINSYIGNTITSPIGGEVYIMNGAGVLFGRGSQVNVGGLIASTLDVDDADYLSGFANSLSSTAPTFKWVDAPGLETFDHPDNYVQVDPGAEITTASGGRVYLLAKRVENNGTIRTPNKGQTVLASGSEVYLQDPNADTMYAAEVSRPDATIPTKIAALSGFLVEVGGNGNGVNAGATNNGVIEALRGNVTIVGMAVNQNGRISASTSVADRGSVFLLARGNVQASSGVDTSGNKYTVKRATTGGTLTMAGAESKVIITPEVTITDGVVDKVDANGYFSPSRIELSGRTIEMKDGASIRAPGAVVNATAFANAAPTVADSVLKGGSGVAVAQTDARIIMGAGASVDVSGATSAETSVADFFVSIRRSGVNELKDAPLQKSGILYHERLVFDARTTAPILGDTSTYLATVGRSADNWLASGGKVTFATDGAVLTHATSSVNISGGQVKYDTAMVSPTTVIAGNGQRYSLATAPTNLQYVAVAAASKPKNTRFGAAPQAGVGAESYLEAGYVAGLDAGSFSVLAPQAVLDGSLSAQASAGRRQLTGLDALPKGGTLQLGLDVTSGASTAAMRDLIIAQGQASALGQDAWNAPTTATLPDHSQISATMLNKAGLGSFKAYVDGSIVQQQGADLVLPDLAAVDLRASGAQGVVLGGNIVAHGGTVKVTTSDNAFANASGGSITLASGKQIDVSGNWVNRFTGDPALKAALAGGTVELKSFQGLELAGGSIVDVSGGATVNRTGTAVIGSDAGSIALSADTGLLGPGGQSAGLFMNGELKGYSSAKGGKLTLSATDIDIHAEGQGPMIASTANGGLQLGTEFFNQGGFSSYALDGRSHLTVRAGAVLAPTSQSWVATDAAVRQATGAKPAAAMGQANLSVALRAPTGLSLNSTGVGTGAANGELTVAEGAAINAEAGAKVALKAGRSLVVNGQVTTPGGSVSLEQSVDRFSEKNNGVLRVGSNALIDVSGTTVLKPVVSGVQRGTVQAGGSITITGGDTARPVELLAGSTLRANGTVGTVDIDRPLGLSGNAATVRTVVATQGGSISINTKDGGAVVAADMQAKGGNASVTDGSFALSINTLNAAPMIVVQDGPVTSNTTQAGQATVSAQMLNNNFSSVTLQAVGAKPGTVKLVGSGKDSTVTLAVNKSLTVDAANLQVDARAATLAARSVLTVGNSKSDVAPAAASGGSGSHSLSLSGGLVTLVGKQSLQGVDQLNVSAGRELRLQGVGVSTGADVGALNTVADISFVAPQVVPTTHTTYTINAPGKGVTISGGDRSLPTPLSAGASLTVNAADINQNGVLLAPFGQITFNATNSITLGAGGLTSVSGAGISVPYGYILDGAWTYQNTAATRIPLTDLPEKTLTLNAASKTITTQLGSVQDLSGGGDLLAYQFIPGAGGSKDIFSGSSGGSFAIVPTVNGYAPFDSTIYGQADSAGLKTAVQAGQLITFGAGGPVPAGTYAVLPARYALLPNAYLIQPNSSKVSLAQGVALKQQDGSFLVGATRSIAGTSFVDAQPTTYRVMTSDLARTYSEVRTVSANGYFADLATKSDKAIPRLAQDAGTLNVAAAKLTLAGQSLFKLPNAASRGGEANFSGNVHVGDTPLQGGDAMELTVAQLSNIGAQSVLLGGSRSQSSSGERAVTTTASKVVVDGNVNLTASDLIITATDLVDIQDGARITASGAQPAQAVSLSNNGASLRVSTDASASVTRSYSADDQGYLLGADGKQLLVNGQPVKAGDSGTLKIGNQVVITGPAISAEVSKSLSIAPSATLKATDNFSLGARRFAVGDTHGVSAGDLNGALVLGSGLAQTLQNSQSVTLKAVDSIDLYANAQIGSDTQRALTLDTRQILVKGQGTQARITAGDVALVNTSGQGTSATPVMSGTGSALTVAATGKAGGSGQLTLGPGSVAVVGTEQVGLQAATDVQTNGAAFKSDGNLKITAQRVVSARATNNTLDSAGAITVAGNGVASAKAAQAAGAGAALQLSAARIEQGGKIELPSGSLTLQATGAGVAGGQDAITFAAGSVTDLSGRATVIDGQVINAQGGQLLASANAGSITLAGADGASGSAAAVIDVSGARASQSAQTLGRAGSVTMVAAAGNVNLDGRLRGLSAAGQSSGSLKVDSLNAVSLSKLAATLEAEQAGVARNFAGELSLRNRQGNQVLTQGATLSARQIAVVADAGDVDLSGTLNASGASGGRIDVAAGKNLSVSDGALLDAHATNGGHDGGQVQLASAAGRLSLQGGEINVTGGGALPEGAVRTGETGRDGVVLLRAQRVQDANGVGTVAIDDIKTRVTGARTVVIDAAKTYQVANATAASFNTALQLGLKEAQAFAKASATSVTKSLTASQAGLASVMQVSPDIELQSQGDMVVGQAVSINASGSNTPIALTLRAKGNLTVNSNISSGFSGDDPVAGSGAIRLVAGADLTSADMLATLPAPSAGGGGNLSVNAAVVRTTTGDLDAVAANNVALNGGAALYTTGLAPTEDELAGYFTAGSGYYAPTRGTPFLSGGGAVRVRAGNDVSAAADGSNPKSSWWSVDGIDNIWWSEYTAFNNGVAAFGGGGVQVVAGRDVSSLNIATPESGYIGSEKDPVNPGSPAAITQRFGGGDVAVAAGRDVRGGLLFSGGGVATVQAGRDISANDAGQSLKVAYTNSQIDLGARRDLQLSAVQAAGWLGEPQDLGYYLGGLSVGSSLRALASGGDVAYNGNDSAFVGASGSMVSVLPNRVDFLSPAGSILLDSVYQAPSGAGHFFALADDNLTVDRSFRLKATTLDEARPVLTYVDIENMPKSLLNGDEAGGVDMTTRLVAARGDFVQAGASISTAHPLRIIAGHDVLGLSQITALHTDPTDVSLIQAGRDVVAAPVRGGGIKVVGAGDLIVVAGRNVNLGITDGVVADGNTENAALPRVSAGITVLAGVSLADGSADYATAHARFFELLGGAGVADYAGDLAAQLAALQSGQGLPGVGSVAAAEFAALGSSAQLDRARALVGDATYNQAVLTYMRNHDTNPALDVGQALSNVAALSALDQKTLAGQALAAGWTATVPLAAQRATALAMASTTGSPYADALTAFVASRSQGGSNGARLLPASVGASAATSDTLAQFAALAPEEKLLFTNQVLRAELIAAGKAGSSLKGDEQLQAYAKGYNALATVFPGSKTRSEVLMTSSQIKTTQNSPINVLIPHGGVNVGEPVSDGLSGKQIGVVTAGGGNLDMIVRDNLLVNTSRVFTVGQGDLLLWSSNGDIDGGKGAKTVVGAPPPRTYIDENGNFQTDTSGSFSGSGIATLDKNSVQYLFAPRGEIIAGDAGIRASGTAYLGGTIRDAGGLEGGAAAAAPAPAAQVNAAANVQPPAATSAGQRDAEEKQDEATRKKKKRNVLLDFLGFGSDVDDIKP